MRCPGGVIFWLKQKPAAFEMRRASKTLADSEIFRGCFSAVFLLFIAHLGTFIEGAQAGFFDGRNVHEHILAAAVGLNESKTFGRIKPLHRPCRHVRTPIFTTTRGSLGP